MMIPSSTFPSTHSTSIAYTNVAMSMHRPDVGDEDHAGVDEVALVSIVSRVPWKAKRSLKKSMSRSQDIKTSQLPTAGRHGGTSTPPFVIALIYAGAQSHRTALFNVSRIRKQLESSGPAELRNRWNIQTRKIDEGQSGHCQRRVLRLWHILLLVVDRFASGVSTLDGLNQTGEQRRVDLVRFKGDVFPLSQPGRKIDSKICKDRAGDINYADAKGEASSASMLIEEVEGICGG